MTLREIILQGPARNRTLRPEDCVFSRSDVRMLERWAKDNGVLWVDGDEVTASNLDRTLHGDLFCVLALEQCGKHKRQKNMGWKTHGLCTCGEFNQLNEALEEAKKQQTEQTNEGGILLNRQAVIPQRARELPTMEF